MEWVSLLDYENGMNFDDAPRLLTQEELTYITAHIPYAPTADLTSAEIIRQGVIEWMIETLKDLAIAPSAIPELIQNIIHQHNKSLIVPGTPVGIAASETVGASTTQMTLNSVAPWEKILIQESSGLGKVVSIGDWIDELLEANPDKIIHIPENRTQYLELDKPVTIATPDKQGNVNWDTLTAVTKHLPVGDLVKVTTKSGRTVTATQSKSMLIWNGQEIVGVNGSDVKVGDLVPILNQVPEPITPTPEFCDSSCFLLDKILLASKELITYFLSAYFNEDKHLNQESGNITFTSDSNDTISKLSFLCSRLGIHGELSENSLTIRKYHADLFRNLISSRVITNFESDYKQINNVILDPIVSIEMVPATEFVYDVTVPNTLNFSLFNGMGVNDTFHASGASTSASAGIDAMRDIIFARKTPKNESSTIYFTNKNITYEEVLETRRFIVGSVMQDFIKDYDIDTPSNLERYWWHDTAPILLNKQIPQCYNVLRLYLNIVEMFKQKVTIEQLANVLARENPASTITIYGPIGDAIIDVYPHQVVLKDEKLQNLPVHLKELTYLETIVVPELPKIRVKGISKIRNLIPITSKTWSMVLLERKLVEKDLTTPELKRDLGHFLGNTWLLFYNKSVMKSTGLKPENLSALCTEAGITVLGQIPDRLVIVMPNDNYQSFNGEIIYKFGDKKYHKLSNTIVQDGVRYRLVDKSYYKQFKGGWKEHLSNNLIVDIPHNNVIRVDNKLYKIVNEENLISDNDILYELVNPKLDITEIQPNAYVENKVAIAKREYRNEVERLKLERNQAAHDLPEAQRAIVIRKPIILERPRILKAYDFMIAEASGDNLKELLALPGIDKKRTTCNNIHTISDTLGIEATRYFTINALNNTISNNGNYVNPNNILIIAEFITNKGKPYGATYTGISRQSGGHLSLATLERAGKVFTQNALLGKTEDIRNVSASVAVGARMAIGSGSFDIGQDITENGITRTVLNDDIFKALDRDDENNAKLEQLIDQEQYNTVDVDDVVNTINDLKLGGLTFDYTGEDDTNLIKLFNESEMAGATSGTDAQDPKQKKVIRRVQPTIPSDLIDTLSHIKEGVPLPERDARIEIKPLEMGITVDQVRPKPIISTGLIPAIELSDNTADIGIPTGLEDLLNQYFEFADTPLAQTVPMPEEPISDLPSLQGFSLAQGAIEMRREQVRDLEPIDVDALKKGLEGQ